MLTHQSLMGRMMVRKADEMKAVEVARLREPGMHAVGVPAGLYLRIGPGGGRSWIMRKSVAGRRRDMGLGAYPDVPLADAQRKARELAEAIRDGRDPLGERRARASAARAARAGERTFEQVAAEFIATHEAGWRNAKHAQQWASTLATYAYPVMGKLLVRDIERVHVLQVLEPIWTTKNETATRVRSRIEQVLGYAMQRDYRPAGLNPARWKDNLDRALAAPAKVAKVEHHRALRIDDMPSFMAKLREMPGMGARALQFVVLTAARSGEVRGATWQEVDLDAATWTVPGARMKAGKEHRVPLAPAAVELLRTLHAEQQDPAADALVFPSAKGGPLSDMTLTAVMRRMNVDAVPHGLRSTFRDWAAERTGYPREVAEMALAHTIPDAVEAAYRRGDLFDKRRRMMADWAVFITGPAVVASVTPLRRGRA
jgi:integrase